jgi:hypothetical protein
METIKILSKIDNLFIHFIWQVSPENLLIAGMPIVKNIFYKTHKKTIALNVGLFP